MSVHGRMPENAHQVVLGSQCQGSPCKLKLACKRTPCLGLSSQSKLQRRSCSPVKSAQNCPASATVLGKVRAVAKHPSPSNLGTKFDLRHNQ